MIRGLAILTMVLLLGAWVVAQDEEPPSAPKQTGVVERAQARLIQIDVNLRGPQEALDSLTLDDFRLTVGMRAIDDFEVDKVCRDPEQSRSIEMGAGDVVEPAHPLPAPTLGPTTFLFYFDQQHLTMGGRQESISILKQMIPELIRDGNRGSLVSNAAKLETLAEVTTDPDVLLAALKAMQSNFDHFDAHAQQETRRVEEVLEYLGLGTGSSNPGDYQQALTLARQYYHDELWRVERNLRRFSMVLGRLATVDRPKAVIYFADNMRRKAGEHYLDLFGEFAKRETSTGSNSDDLAAGGTAMGAQMPFDELVNQAAANGIRFYPIEGQGLETSTHGAPTTARFRASESTLLDLAAETGGEAFLNGIRSSKIIAKLEEDLSCMYMVSFTPERLPEDVAQKVVVLVDKPEIKVQSRGRVIVQSDSARKTSRLMAAFASPKSGESTIAVHPTVVPTGYADGKFNAVVQVTVPRSEVPASTWDLGASVISRGKSREASGRLTVSHAGAAVILQESMTFSPGPFEVVAVAHNTTVDDVASQNMEGEWPKPNAERAALGPIAVVQTAKAAIMRDDTTKTSGFVAFAEHEPVLVGRSVMLVTLVCKSNDVTDDLLIERQLVGASRPVSFEPLEIELEDEPCALIHDTVEAHTMTPGAFRYRIQVHDNKDELVRGERRFFVWTGSPLADSPTATAPTADADPPQGT